MNTRLPAPARREQILDVSVQVFARRGFHSTSMNDVAEAAGVTKPVLYQHFDSKQDLYLALLDEAVSEMRTGKYAAVPSISNKLIRPYTDLLLHDMGTGLADGRPDYEASGSEWRTTPLWGIGLTEVVNGHSFFLHDGRARSMLEAVLWHAGEAEKAKNAVRQASHDDREALLAFLESL